MAPPAHQLAGTLDNAGAIGVDVPCVACQYNLRGLTPEGTCPECGQAIAESLHAWQEAQHSGLNDPVFVRKLGRGMDIGLTAVVLALMGLLAFVIAIKCAWPRDVRMTLAWTMVILEAMACCLGGWGFWLFTAPSEVYPRLRRSIVRILLRWFTLVCLAQCALLILDLWDLPYWITHFTEMGIPLTAFCSLIFLKTYGVILANRLGNVTLGTFMGLSLAADLDRKSVV